jgi:hypothetical protein
MTLALACAWVRPVLFVTGRARDAGREPPGCGVLADDGENDRIVRVAHGRRSWVDRRFSLYLAGETLKLAL